MNTTTLELPVLPVSFNKTRYAPWYQARALGQPLRDALILYLRTASDLPKGLTEVVASAELTFKTRGRRDEGNFRTPLEKALGDVLVAEGFLPDDTPDHFRMERVVILPDPGKPGTLLNLDWRKS